MRQGGVRYYFRFERRPLLSNSHNSSSAALRRLYAMLIDSEDERVFNEPDKREPLTSGKCVRL